MVASFGLGSSNHATYREPYLSWLSHPAVPLRRRSDHPVSVRIRKGV